MQQSFPRLNCLDQSNEQMFISAAKATRELKVVLGKIIKLGKTESWRLLLYVLRSSTNLLLNNGGRTKRG